MAHEKVTGYKIAWDLDDGKGIIDIRTSNNSFQVEVSAEAFSAITSVLQHQESIYYDTDQNKIYVGGLVSHS